MTARAPSGRSEPWRSIPGGPTEPNFNAQRAAVQAINAERTKLYERLDDVRRRLDALAPSQSRGGGGTAAALTPEEEERRRLQQRLADIVSRQRQERHERSERRKAVSAAKDQIDELRQRLRRTQQDVGVFESVEEIQRATALLMRRLETGGGGLKAEKKTVQRLQQLEASRALLEQIAPLEEALEEAEMSRTAASKEYEAVIARLDALNKDYEDHVQAQQRLASDAATTVEASKVRAERNTLLTERRTISAELTALAERLQALHKSFDAQVTEWRAWKVQAMELYRQRVEKQRQEAAERREAALRQRREERRRKQLALARNPHAKDIATCGALLRFLEDRSIAEAREKAVAARRAKAVAMAQDSTRTPSDMVILRPKDDLEADDGLAAMRKKKNKSAPKKSGGEKSGGGGGGGGGPTAVTRPMALSAEKRAMFEAIGVAPPTGADDIERAVADVTAKRKEYEARIVPDDVEIPPDALPPLSGDVTEEEEEEEGMDEEKVAQPPEGGVAAAVDATAAETNEA